MSRDRRVAWVRFVCVEIAFAATMALVLGPDFDWNIWRFMGFIIAMFLFGVGVKVALDLS